jgi:hypothetical protein
MNKLKIIGIVLLHTSFLAYSQQKTITVEVRRNIEVLSTLNNLISTSFLKDSIADPFFTKTLA